MKGNHEGSGTIKETGMKKLILALITLTVMAAIGCVRLPAADTNVIYVSDDTVETEAVSAGTGFFVTDNGVIVTSAHVIEYVDKITVVINDIEYPAEVLQRDEENDLAVLKINYNNSYHFKIVNFEPIHPGDRLSALGFPFALHDDFITSEPRFTEGTLSAKTGLRSMQASFQHSVPTQPGNSGGPLFNNRNEVVGVVFARADASLNPQNVNFGIRSDNIFPLLNKSNIRPGNGNIRNNTGAQNAVVLILGYLVAANDGPPVTIVNNTGYLV